MTYIRRRPLSFTDEDVADEDRYGWADRPDAVYVLAERNDITDETVIEFARWMCWRAPTRPNPEAGSPLELFIEAYANGDPRGNAPSVNQALAALDLVGVAYKESKNVIVIAIPASVTREIILPMTNGYNGNLQFVDRTEVTYENLRKAYASLDMYDKPDLFPRRRWFETWAEAVAADADLNLEPYDPRPYFDPWNWISTRPLEQYQQIADCFREWFPTTGQRPVTAHTLYQHRSSANTYKHMVESELGIYVPEGDLILVAHILGFRTAETSEGTYVSVPPRFGMMIPERFMSYPFHGEHRSELYGRLVPDDYVEKGLSDG